MNKLNQLIEKIKPFFQKYGLFITPILLFILFMTLIILSSINSLKKSSPTISTPPPVQSNIDNSLPIGAGNSNQSNETLLSPFPSSDGMDPDNDEPNEPVWSA